MFVFGRGVSLPNSSRWGRSREKQTFHGKIKLRDSFMCDDFIWYFLDENSKEQLSKEWNDR